jgi:hypothetical protein
MIVFNRRRNAMERHSTIVELLKYPLLVFSALIALVLARYLLGLEFGVVTEVGTQGVKFAERNQATLAAVANIEGKVNQALVELELLKKSQPAAGPVSRENTARLVEAAQTVSDQTARVEQIGTGNPTGNRRLKGYIWIGDFDGAWRRAKLAPLDTGQPVNLSPEKLLPGTEYTVLGNMVVREKAPADDEEYYRGVNSLGVIPRGTKVRLVSAPIVRSRESAVQYWAEVEVPPELLR